MSPADRQIRLGHGATRLRGLDAWRDLADAWRSAGASVELHLLERGGHGMGECITRTSLGHQCPSSS